MLTLVKKQTKKTAKTKTRLKLKTQKEKILLVYVCWASCTMSIYLGPGNKIPVRENTESLAGKLIVQVVNIQDYLPQNLKIHSLKLNVSAKSVLHVKLSQITSIGSDKTVQPIRQNRGNSKIEFGWGPCQTHTLLECVIHFGW